MPDYVVIALFENQKHLAADFRLQRNILHPDRDLQFQFDIPPRQDGSVANSWWGKGTPWVPGLIYAAMPKMVWMNWRCATGSPLATQRT